MRGLACLVVLLLAGCGGEQASLAVHAGSGLADAPATVRVTVDGPATLKASWRSVDGSVWHSSVPLKRTATIAAARLITPMRQDGPAYKHPFFVPPARGETAIALRVVAGGKTLARATLPRRVTPPGMRIRHLTIKRDGLVGVLFLPPGRARKPAAVLFGGSEGGNTMTDAAGLLAAHGYPTLALAYFGEPGLPHALVRIRLEYFARAVRLLRRQPGADPAHVVVMGVSRGGEAALLLASTFPELIHGAVGLVPSATVYPAPAAQFPAWTQHGKAVPLDPIRVERISGPVLTVGAGQDLVWSSTPSVREIERRLKEHRFRFHHEGIVYARAGHLVGGAIPYLPAPPGQQGAGGSGRADAAARAELWPRILHFFAGLR